MNYKKYFFFFLTLLFCCNVGEHGVNISVGNGPFHKFHKNKAFMSASEVLYQKVLCVVFYKSKITML